MDELRSKKQGRMLLLLASMAVSGALLLIFFRLILPASGLGTDIQPTSSIPPQIMFWTEIAETRETVRGTPWPTLPPASPYPPNLNTPDYRPMIHHYTEQGVILGTQLLDHFATCPEDSIVYQTRVKNLWIPLDHPPYPYRVFYVGAYGEGDSPEQSAVFIWEHETDSDPCSLEPVLAPITEGPLEIIAVQGKELLLRSTVSGETIAFDTESRSFREGLSIPTPGPSPTPNPDLTPPSDLGYYVIYASKSVLLGPEVKIRSGSVGVQTDTGGFLELKNDVSTEIFVDLVADRIRTGPGSVIFGDVFFNRLDAHRSTEFFSRQSSPVDLNLALPEMPDIPEDVGTLDKVVATGAEETIEPGTYRSIRIKPNATLTLVSGIYNLGELQLDQGAELLCAEACSLRVRDQVIVGSGATLQQPALSVDRFILYILGKQGFRTLQGARVRANVVAPNGSIVLGTQGAYTGGFYAHTVEVENKSAIYDFSAFLE